MNSTTFKTILILVIIVLLISVSFVAFTSVKTKGVKDKESDKTTNLSELGIKSITKKYIFSNPILSEHGDYLCIYVDESDFNSISDGLPVLPVNLTTFEFPFGTKIIDFKYEYSKPEKIALSKKISYGSCSTITTENENIYNNSARFPSSFVSYHTGGGLSNDEYRTFLSIRVYPITYIPVENEIEFVRQVEVEITYKEPDEPLLDDRQEYDLLIITPSIFKRPLKPLVKHKNKEAVKTILVTLDEVYEKDFGGRDEQEQIKYYIKYAIENWRIKYVLLVGGMKGQGFQWNLPVRYSHVLVSPGKQEIPEPEFISDLYFADIYDSEGNFSSWDSNCNNIFAEWDGDQIDDMDLYPDVYLGRLPCRNRREVRIMVDKIIKYETRTKDKDWFKNLVLLSGDHWNDKGHINEGELIMEAATQLMPGFNPVKLYASMQKINFLTINRAINQGCGFAYICGHGSPYMWGTHYPPDGTEWTGFYEQKHMNFLINRYKLPVVVVGGCHNGKYDISILKNMKKGIEEGGIWGYFRLNPFKKGLFWTKGYISNCWSWKLASKKGGGGIAVISNTGLGTHAMDDADNNSINDYLEVLDGWLELRFFQLYGQEQKDILGELHGEAITCYLNRFLGNNDEMDPKMVQQWQLMGDPSLKVGGY